MLKKTQQSVAAIGAPAQQVANSVNKIGAAAKQTQTFMDKLVSSLGRIALFSVGAGLVVRGFFEIISAIRNTIAEGIKFNATMEQGRIALAAILANTRNVSDAQGRVLSIAESYPLLLEKARDIQRQILLANIETLGTGQELAEVYQLVLANTGQQAQAEGDVLKASQIILNISRLNNEAGEKAVVNARQAFVLEGMRGNTVLRYLNTNIKVARELSAQGQWLQEIIKRGEIYLLLSGEIGDSWEALTSTVETFFSTIAGQAFSDIFEGLKVVIKGMGEELLRIDAAGGLKAALNVSDADLKKLGQSLARITVAFIKGIAEATAAIIKFAADTRSVFEWFSSSQAAGIIGSFVAKVIEGWKIIFDGWRLLWEQIAANAGPISDIAIGLAKLIVVPFTAAFDAIRQGFLTWDIGTKFVEAIGTRTAEALNQIGRAGTKMEFVPPTLNKITDSLNKSGNAGKDAAGKLNLLPKPIIDAEKAAQAAAKAIQRMKDSLNQQLISLQAERAELSQGTEAALRIKLAKELANAATRDLAEAVIVETLALEREKKTIDNLEASYKELQSSLGEQSDFLKSTEQGLKDNIEVLEEQNRIVLDAIATGRNWEETQVDLEVATERFRIAQEALAKGIPISTQALQDMAEKSVRLQHEFDKNKETAEVMSESFLFSFTEIQDVFDEVVRGIAGGTSDLSDIFVRQGQALGASLITGILVGKSRLEGGIGRNFNQLLGLGPGGILGIFAQGGSNAAGAFFGGFLPDFQGIFGSLSAIGSNLFGGTAGFSSNLQSLMGSFGTVGGAALGFGIAEGLKSVFGVGGTFEGGIGSMILGTGGALGGAAIGATFGAAGGPIGAAIGAVLGSVLGAVFGDLFANLPTKGTQIRQGVVEWLEDIDASFAGQVESGKYFFKTTKALADELGIGFLEASKMVLEDKAGPEIARQLQALGAFITAEAAEELGKPLEQTAATFGNMLIANLGIEAIPEAMAEIIEKVGITFEAVINSLNKAFEEGRISVEFYNDTIQGAIDLFLTDLPAALDVAAVAMQSFTEDGIFSLEIFEEKLEQAVENFTTIGEAAAQALTQGIEEGLSASEVGDLFEEILKAALRGAAIAEFVEKFFEDLFRDIDLTKPFELSSEAMEELRKRIEGGADALRAFLNELGLLPEAFSEAAFAADLSQSVESSVFQGVFEAFQNEGLQAAINLFGTNLHNTLLNFVLGALFQAFAAQIVLPLIQPIINGFAAASAQLIAGMITAEQFSVLILAEMAAIPAAISSIIPILAEALAIADAIAAELGAAFAAAGVDVTPVVVTPPPSSGGGGSSTDNLAQDLQDTFDAFIESANAFQEATEDAADPLGDLVDEMIELEAAMQAALETGLDDIQVTNEWAETQAAFLEEMSDIINEFGTFDSIFSDLMNAFEEGKAIQEALRLAYEEGLITQEEWASFLKEFAIVATKELITQLRAITEEIMNMVEETQDAIEGIQEFIDAGADLSDLESDLADLTDEYEQALKDLRKEMLGVILSGESMGQMLEDVNESFENQAQAIGDALIEDLTNPINDFLKSIDKTDSTIDSFNSDFAAMMSDFDEAIAAGDFEAVGEAVNDMVELAEEVHNLIEAFDDLIDSIDDSIQELIEGGMTLEERANVIGGRIAEGFATIGSMSFEDQLDLIPQMQADLVEQFNVLEELERQRLADAIAVQEAVKEARQEEIQGTIDSLDERIRAHEDAQREIEQVEEEISRIQIDIRRRDLQAALDVIDERIRLAEQANADLLSAEEKAAADLLNLQEQTNEELIRMAEDFRSAAESIREAIDDILLSDVSPLTPVQRLQEAQRQFQNLVTAARGGDVGAARELGGVAQQLLGEASAFFASSAPFQAIFGETIKTLDELGIQFDQRAFLSEQEIVKDAILLTGGENLEELREMRQVIEQDLLGLDDTLEDQLAEAQGRLAELNSTLENNVDELIVTRDALVQELEDLDEAFNRDVEELTKAFDVLISGHRKDTVDQLLALKGIAETSRDSLQDIETDVVAELTDIADNVIPTAVNDIVGTFLPPVDALAFNTGDLGPIVKAINKPLWVDSMITVLNNIASKVGAAAVSVPSPPFQGGGGGGGGGGFVSPPSGPRVLTWPGFGSSPPSPSLLSQFDFVQFALPGGGFSNLVKAQHGGIFTRPTMGLLGEAGPEAVIPLRRSESVFDIDYDRLGAVVAEALSGNNNGPSQNNINIEVKTEDGETIVRRTIRTMSDESRTGKIFIDARAIGKYRRL